MMMQDRGRQRPQTARAANRPHNVSNRTRSTSSAVAERVGVSRARARQELDRQNQDIDAAIRSLDLWLIARDASRAQQASSPDSHHPRRKEAMWHKVAEENLEAEIRIEVARQKAEARYQRMMAKRETTSSQSSAASSALSESSSYAHSRSKPLPTIFDYVDECESTPVQKTSKPSVSKQTSSMLDYVETRKASAPRTPARTPSKTQTSKKQPASILDFVDSNESTTVSPKPSVPKKQPSKESKSKEPKSPRTLAKEREAGLERPKHPLFRSWLEELEAKEVREEEERRVAAEQRGEGRYSPRRNHEPPSEVIPGYLWLSGLPETRGMEHLPFDKFDVVIYAQSSRDAKTKFACDKSHLVYCYDTPDSDISHAFIPTHTYIQQNCPLEFSRGVPKSRVLVHCTQGVSRSVSLLAAHLMQQHRCTLRDAMLFIKWRRSRAAPNEGFINQLVAFEKQIHPDQLRPSITYSEAKQMGMVY